MQREFRKMGTYGAESRIVRSILVAGGLGILASGSAMAADLGTYKPAAEPAPPSRRCELSANVALTTDYVFRGVSQTDENAAIQGGFDVACGRFYAGVWASNLDFGGETTLNNEVVDVANIEIDYYLGITHTIPMFGSDVEFDLGAIYYTYPNAFDSISLVNGPLGELDYWEVKFGLSTTVLRDVGLSTTVYYSPEYTGEIGDNVVWETSLEKPLGAGFSLSGTFGAQWGDENAGGSDYNYWNAGLSKEFHEKFTLDVRYWDTDISGCGSATIFQCDERIVGTLSASF
jgi:uncharacterized protein (TIGR02001 family)